MTLWQSLPDLMCSELYSLAELASDLVDGFDVVATGADDTDEKDTSQRYLERSQR